MEVQKPLMDIEKIQEVLPHRYPFLLVDKVLEIQEGPEPGKRQGRTIKAVKCVTYNEPFFQGHFPQKKVMPGVLLVETMAQAGGLGFFLEDDEAGEIMIASINSAKFRQPVVPGDQLMITVKVAKERRNMIVLEGKIEVDGEKVCEANIMAFVTIANA